MQPRLEHEGARRRLEVRLARIIRTGPPDERVHVVGNDSRVVEHLAQLLGVDSPPRARRRTSRVATTRGPAKPPRTAAVDQRGERRATDRRRGEHQVVAPEGRHGQTYTWARPPARYARLRPCSRASVADTARSFAGFPTSARRRRPGDAVRVVVVAIVLTLLALHANSPTAAERALARFFRLLPDDAHTFILIFYDLLALWALALVAFALILVRRWRLARDIAAAGALAWVDRPPRRRCSSSEPTSRHAFSITFDLADVPRFPLVRISIAVAVITVASPYLARPTRRVGQGIVLLLAIATMYLGRSFPADIVGAIVLGWGIAALVHLHLRNGRASSDGRAGGARAHRPRRSLRPSPCRRRAAGCARDLFR